MKTESTQNLSVLMKYGGWLLIYGVLFLLVSLPAVYFLDHLFPRPAEILGRPASFHRIGVIICWFIAVTFMVWPFWHSIGDLFLPTHSRFGRFKEFFEIYLSCQKQQKKGQVRKAEPGGSANSPSARG